jgi:ssDNA-binding replication factor A large subunit
MSTRHINLPKSLNHKIEELSEREGIAADQFIATAVAEKMSALLTEEYLEERGSRASREKYEQALAQVPDVEPEERDRIK